VGPRLRYRGCPRGAPVRFEEATLDEIVSFTSMGNAASMRVMDRLGMHRDPSDDFDYPNLPIDHPLRSHGLYRLKSQEFTR